jgi:aromatic ring-opening dioxygenase LigB subunit
MSALALCASGGLSHFTAGYPWKRYQGPFGYGAISEDFDRRAIAWMERGEGERLAELSGAELLAHGNIELRSWIALLGALGPVRTRFAVYEPFFRAVMGMGVASWPSG